MARFEEQFTIARPRAEVFDFLIQPLNVEEISSPDLGLAIINAPERLLPGARIEFMIQGFGPWQTAAHEITEFQPPQRYVERQVKGVMKSWIHEHLFEEDGEKTIVIDRVEFQPPAGLIGKLATEERILRSLVESISYRNEALRTMLEAEDHAV